MVFSAPQLPISEDPEIKNVSTTLVVLNASQDPICRCSKCETDENTWYASEVIMIVNFLENVKTAK